MNRINLRSRRAVQPCSKQHSRAYPESKKFMHILQRSWHAWRESRIDTAPTTTQPSLIRGFARETTDLNHAVFIKRDPRALTISCGMLDSGAWKMQTGAKEVLVRLREVLVVCALLAGAVARAEDKPFMKDGKVDVDAVVAHFEDLYRADIV